MRKEWKKHNYMWQSFIHVKFFNTFKGELEFIEFMRNLINYHLTHNFFPLQRMHSENLEEYERYKIRWLAENRCKRLHENESDTNDSNNPSSSKKLKQSVLTFNAQPNQKLFNELVVKFVVNGMHSLSIVEEEDFKQLFTRMGFNVNLMSRRTLGRKIDEHYENEKQRIKSLISSGNYYFSTTADVWSMKVRSFLGSTMHYIDNYSLKRHSLAIACRRFEGTHSYDRIASLLDDIFSDFGLEINKNIATTTDNGSNFVKAFKEFGVDFFCDADETDCESSDFLIDSDENTTTDDAENITLPQHKRCAAHTLCLIVTTDLAKNFNKNRIHHPTMAKCNTLWKKASYPKSAELMFEVLGYYFITFYFYFYFVLTYLLCLNNAKTHRIII